MKTTNKMKRDDSEKRGEALLLAVYLQFFHEPSAITAIPASQK